MAAASIAFGATGGADDAAYAAELRTNAESLFTFVRTINLCEREGTDGGAPIPVFGIGGFLSRSHSAFMEFMLTCAITMTHNNEGGV